VSRIALITGASRGIGRAIAEAFQTAGWELLTPSREELDLASPESVLSYCERAKEQEIQALVNNAGINIIQPLSAIGEEDWQKMFQINVTAPRQLIQAVTPGMRRKKHGRIVNISSIFGVVSRQHRASYSVTKAAINALTRTAAIELGPDQILVNSVCPGYVETELTHQNNSPEQLRNICEAIPLGRLAQPREIASVVRFLCSEENSYLTGQNILIDGGFTCQ